MIKQTIEFEDFDGNQVREDHYFHLSKSELIDMELATEGGMAAKLERIGKSSNGAEIIKTFKEILAAAYGQRVDGSGSQFFKSEEISERFMGSLAFDALLTTLLTDMQASMAFVNGLMPKDLVADPAVAQALATGRQVEDVELPWANREPTHKELGSMSAEQLRDVYERKASGWKPSNAA